MPLILGTAQWGTAYGSKSYRSVLRRQEKLLLLAQCRADGVYQVDTAAVANESDSYGDSESVIGESGIEFVVTTKGAVDGKPRLLDRIVESRQKLQPSSIGAFLVHDWHLLNHGQRRMAVDDLRLAKELGLVEKIGISAYVLSDIESASQEFEHLDVLQVPVSVLDQRLVRSDLLQDLSVLGCQIQARSIFLQGQILNRPTTPAIGEAIIPFLQLCREREMTPLDGALDFIRGVEWISACVVGVEGIEQWALLRKYWAREPRGLDWVDCASVDASVIDPRKWNE